MTTSPSGASRLAVWQRRSFMAGGVVFVVCALAAPLAQASFYRAYLIAFLLWSGIALGGLALLMLQHLTGGEWGFVIRRVLEASSRTLPIVAALFLPLVVGMRHLYPWVTDPTLSPHKQTYLNVGFFLARAALYFAVWIAVARQIDYWSMEQDRTRRSYLGRLQILSGVGLVLYGLTMTFAAIDWVMTLEPHWYSTIFGMIIIAGHNLGALAFVIVVLLLLKGEPPMAQAASREVFHDLGNLLLAFVLVWAYLGFSQYLITWSGNLPEEIPWYLHRMRGGWQGVGLFLILFHFALPFAVLLWRDAKRHAAALAAVGGFVLCLRFVDLVWLVTPAFSETVLIHPFDVLAPVAVGGIWLGAFFKQLRSRPLLPAYDARVAAPRVASETA